MFKYLLTFIGTKVNFSVPEQPAKEREWRAGFFCMYKIYFFNFFNRVVPDDVFYFQQGKNDTDKNNKSDQDINKIADMLKRKPTFLPAIGSS